MFTVGLVRWAPQGTLNTAIPRQFQGIPISFIAIIHRDVENTHKRATLLYHHGGRHGLKIYGRGWIEGTWIRLWGMFEEALR